MKHYQPNKIAVVVIQTKQIQDKEDYQRQRGTLQNDKLRL